VTLRQCLSHQAGLEHEWSTPLDEYGDGDDALDRLARGAPAAAPVEPGTWFSYASAGFYIAAAAVQTVAGTTFEGAMQVRILDPLGLARTSFEGASEHPYPRARRGGGGLFSCVHDLLTFGEHLLGGPGPLRRGSIAEMTAPQIAAPGGSYGLGIAIRDVDGRRILEHGGSLPGFKSLLAVAPDEQTAFVGLSSSERGRPAIDAIRDQVLGLETPQPEPAEPDRETLAAAAGAYETATFGVTLAASDGGFDVEIADATERVAAFASPYGPGVFRVFDGQEEGLEVELLEPGLIRVGGMVARRAD
jgi:CubicO group peptidase (beta-lactamase class C family)